MDYNILAEILGDKYKTEDVHFNNVILSRNAHHTNKCEDL